VAAHLISREPLAERIQVNCKSKVFRLRESDIIICAGCLGEWSERETDKSGTSHVARREKPENFGTCRCVLRRRESVQSNQMIGFVDGNEARLACPVTRASQMKPSRRTADVMFALLPVSVVLIKLKTQHKVLLRKFKFMIDTRQTRSVPRGCKVVRRRFNVMID
jgi:hypothetical protein